MKGVHTMSEHNERDNGERTAQDDRQGADDVTGFFFYDFFFGALRRAVRELTAGPIVIPSDTKLYIPQ